MEAEHPVFRGIVEAASEMSDVELLMVLGSVMTVLAKRWGLAKLKAAIEKGYLPLMEVGRG